MDHALARREALRIYRVVLAVKLAFLSLSILAVLGSGGPASPALLVRAAPVLLLALLLFPPWPERGAGRWFLAALVGLDVFFESLQSVVFFFDWPALLADLAEPAGLLARHLFRTSTTEPFLFLLIPLVLLAWGYGRRGALLGSSWAALLHVGTGLWARQMEILAAGFWVGAVTRLVLLYAMPLLVSILAERERRQHAELEVAHQRLRRHTATVEQLAVSRERNRLARDLHDTLAHSLSALAVQLEALRTLMVHDPPAARDLVDELATLARQGLEESRQTIQAIRTDPLETVGLAGALREALLAFQARTGVQAELVTAGGEPDLTADEAQALFRIAQEALSNVERHANASRVTVRLAFGADRADLVVRDDGAGFDPAEVDPQRYGLTGMQERAEMIGATLKVESRPGGGTGVWCTLAR